jgi:hypothetical protein
MIKRFQLGHSPGFHGISPPFGSKDEIKNHRTVSAISNQRKLTLLNDRRTPSQTDFHGNQLSGRETEDGSVDSVHSGEVRLTSQPRDEY